MSAEFQVAGHTYRAGKMDAFTQGYCMKRLAPLLEHLDAIQGAATGGGAAILAALGKAIAAIPDEDVRFVIGKCLAVTQRRKAGDSGWAPIWISDDLMFDDIGFPEMVQISAQVLKEALGPFLGGLGFK